MECAPHRIWKKLMALVLSLVLMAVMLPGALAVDLNVDAGFYFKQSRGGTCTLASAAMMLRRRAFLDGLPARERQIILLRYGLSGQPPLTQLETAKLLQISRSYVSRLETHALELLRAGWEQP